MLKKLCLWLRCPTFIRHDPVILPVSFKPGQIQVRMRALKGSRKTMSLVRQLHDYRITTAEIVYHLPDHPNLLQTYIWQELDIAPRYPVLRKFLDFWTREIEGSLHSVRVASTGMIKPATVGHADALMLIN